MTQRAPKVTVLTAVRNGERYIREAMASVFAQTLTDWEYIVVDDASEDDTAAIVEAATRADARVRLVRRDAAGGPYVAANEGLALAKGDYIARIDADDIALPERLAVQLDFMARHPTLRACGGAHRAIKANGENLSRVRMPSDMPGVLKWRLCFAMDPVHSSAFIERTALLELGGYRPLRLAQDWRLWCVLARRGWLGMVPELVALRRVHDDRLTDREASLQAKFAAEVAQEHIEALSGETWTLDDVLLLRRVAHGHEAALREGSALIGRWAALWTNDSDLTRQELLELARQARRMKLRHVARWVETRPGLASIASGWRFLIRRARRSVVVALAPLRKWSANER